MSEMLQIDPGAATESSALNAQTYNITLIYGSNDPAKGYNIPADKIIELVVRENFFLQLPTMTLKLSDVGTIFHNVGFQIGNTFYLKVMPEMVSDDSVGAKPLLEGTYTIQAIENFNDYDRNSYMYTFHCMYTAEKYLNDICVWPKEDTLAGKHPSIDKSFTSKDALTAILSDAGLKPVADFDRDPNDNMAWLNSTLTYSEFAKKIVNHAWVSDDDMPLLYIDRNGTAYYTSLNTMCSAAVKSRYVHQTVYQKIYDTKNEYTSDSVERPQQYSVYADVSLSNYGFLQNRGGYNVKKYIFNPYNTSGLNTAEFKPVNLNLLNMNATTLNDSCFRYKEFKDTGKDGKLRLASLSNRSDTQGDTIRYNSASVYFQQTHEYYDYAPLHHDSIKHAFFQQFAFMTVSVTDQPGYEKAPSQILKLGDRITIDMSSTVHQDSIQTNDYIVSGLTHQFSFGSKYIIMATCVSDGVGGTSQLRKQTKDTQKVTTGNS